jgi:YHS domain-containing protein
MKKVQILAVVLFFGSFIISCNNGQQANNISSQTDTAAIIKTDSVKYTTAMVDNKKDLNCGMPLSAGIDDTAHYKGKVYGFCSTECKEAFLKNPDSCLAKNK